MTLRHPGADPVLDVLPSHPRPWHGAAYALAAALVFGSPNGSAIAQESVAIVPSTPASGTAAGTDTVRTADRIARAQITLRNPRDAAVSLRPDTAFRSLSRPGTARANWTAAGTGAVPDGGGLLTLPAKSTATFEVEGTLEEAGTYVTTLAVLDENGSVGQQIPVQITRTVRPVPAELIDAPKSVRIDLGFPSAATDEALSVVVAARNATAEPVALGAPAAGRFTRLEGDAATSIAGAEIPAVGAGTCVGSLGPGQECAMTVHLPPGLGPGRYVADVMIGGPGGGQSHASVQIDVRLSAIWTALVVAIGALLGYLVALWRERGRTALDRRIAVAEARARLARLAAGAANPLVRRHASMLQDRIRALDARIATGSDPATDLAAEIARYAALVAAEDAYRQAAAAGGGALLEPLEEALDRTLGGLEVDAAKVRTAADQLKVEAAAIPALVASARRLEQRLADLAPVLAWTRTGAEPLRDAERTARQVLEEAFREIAVPLAGAPDAETTRRLAAISNAAAALESDRRAIAAAAIGAVVAAAEDALAATPPPTDAVRDELVALRDSAASQSPEPDLERVKVLVASAAQLRLSPSPRVAAAPPAVLMSQPIPSLLPADTNLVLDFDPFLFGIGTDVPASRLRLSRNAWGMFANLVMLALIGIAGMMALWVPASTWGSPFDFATALLAGVGTRLVVGALPRAAAG